MPKATRTFRLSRQAVEALDALQVRTGSTRTALVENALAVYAAFLEHGLPLPRGARKAAWRQRAPAHAAPPPPPPPDVAASVSLAAGPAEPVKLTRQQLRYQAREEAKRRR